MATIADIRRTHHVFLNADQSYSLINILTKQCKKDIKLKMGEIVRNSFYSLDEKPYWKDFVIHPDYIEYVGKEEIKDIRQDILDQR
jgi:hypothetical protein